MDTLVKLLIQYGPMLLSLVSHSPSVQKVLGGVQKALPVAVAVLDGADKVATAIGDATGKPASVDQVHHILTALHTDADLLNHVLANVTSDHASMSADVIDRMSAQG